MQFAAHGIRGLFGERGNLVVTHLLIGDEKQQQAIFFGETGESCLNALAEFLGFQRAEW